MSWTFYNYKPFLTEPKGMSLETAWFWAGNPKFIKSLRCGCGGPRTSNEIWLASLRRAIGLSDICHALRLHSGPAFGLRGATAPSRDNFSFAFA